MQNQISNEMHVFDRMMHLLEEGSVGQLVKTDDTFAQIIADLYQTIDAHMCRLEQSLV